MTSKTMGSKLADSLRQVRGEKPATVATPPPAPAEKPAAARAEQARVTTAGAATSARQSDPSPASSLDRPWQNLHPARIWPD